MSAIEIRTALETALNGMSPALVTAWENQAFNSQPASTAYQQPFLMLAAPENVEMGASYRQSGVFQINLFYPPQAGYKDAVTRAEAIRTLFKRGQTFVSGAVKVIISDMPEIGQGRSDGDHWMLPVKVRFYANIIQ